MATLPWEERVAMLSINPDAANAGDIARLASEWMELALQDRLKTREINTLVPENRNLIAQLRETRVCLGGILGMIGNVNHTIGHGPNAAFMRGDMLNSIRDMAQEAFNKTAPKP